MDRHGGLSNDSPPRYLVTLDVLTSDQGLARKKRFTSWESWADKILLEPLVRGQLSRLKVGILELLTFGLELSAQESLWSRLEQEGWPIRYHSNHLHRMQAIRSLTYRPEVTAIIDVPEYLLFWGHRGTTLSEVGNI